MANASVVGVVSGIVDDRDAKLVIVTETRGAYTDEVAVRFWGKTVPLIAGLAIGSKVAIAGYVKSRKGTTGDRYFTEFSGADIVIESGREPGNEPF